MKPNYKDENWIGQKFNRLTVIAFERVRHEHSTSIRWIVRCDCGTLKSVSPYRVLSGNTKSCGCLKSENTIAYNRVAKKKHGGRRDRLYYIWRGMKQRCFCETNKEYPTWGGRGIVVCDEWKDDYASFRDWSLNNGYADDLTIDRIDVNGNYCPQNCRWVDWKTQAANRRDTMHFVVNGEDKTLSQLSDEYGIKYTTLYQRVCKYRWPLEKALSVPVRDNFAPNGWWRDQYGA